MGLSPADLTIAGARRELAAGGLSSVELTEAVLARVAERNQELNAYLHVDAEGALAQARAADGRRDGGSLNGIPLCVKDVVDVAGAPTTAGSAGWSRTPSRDAPAVARLREAGAVIVGKGHTNEFAYGVDGLNPHLGDCLNPHDPARVCGGSSSGPAVATATGMALAGLGSDTSGSLRVPASLCGLVGVRPTLGLVPRSGVVPLAWSYDTVGPLARTVEDAAVVLDALSGAGPSVPAAEAGVAGLRIGVVEELMDAAEPYVAEGVARVVQELAGLGAEIAPLRFQLLRRATAMHLLVQQAEAARVHAPWFHAHRDGYAEPVRRRLEAGRLIPTSAYLAAQQARRLLVEEVARVMEGVDAMVLPATPLVAPRRDAAEVALRGESVPLRVALLTCVVPTSQLGSPAVSVPAGSEDGLPYGIQIVGRPFSEPLVLRIAAACERVSQWALPTGSGAAGAGGAGGAGRSAK